MSVCLCLSVCLALWRALFSANYKYIYIYFFLWPTNFFDPFRFRSSNFEKCQQSEKKEEEKNCIPKMFKAYKNNRRRKNQSLNTNFETYQKLSIPETQKKSEETNHGQKELKKSSILLVLLFKEISLSQ